MEFRDVVMKRRAVRRMDGGVEPAVIERIARSRSGPSAGFSQGQRLIVVTDAERRRQVARICGEEEMVADFDHVVSESAAQFIPCVAGERDLPPPLQRARRVEDDGAEIEWPVPFWWVDIGATMQTIMLAAVDEGLGCGFIGPDIEGLERVPRDTGGVRPDRRHAGRPARLPTSGHQASNAAGSRWDFARRERWT